MSTVRHILEEKGSAAWSISPSSSVMEALRLMAEKDVGALLVTDSGPDGTPQVVGIFSERDFARLVADTGSAATDQPVEQLMTSRVYYARPDTTLDQCMSLMTSKRIRHLPILEAGQLVGLVSIGDVVRALISDRESTIRGLENYIISRDRIV